MTLFKRGNVVVAKASTQGMEKLERYTIDAALTNSTPWGIYVTYVLRRKDGTTFGVTNGHLLLEREFSMELAPVVQQNIPPGHDLRDYDNKWD